MNNIKNINGIDVLFINEKPATCPFKNAIPIQDKFNQLQIINNECSSACPHFIKKSLVGATQIDLKCVRNNILIIND